MSDKISLDQAINGSGSKNIKTIYNYFCLALEMIDANPDLMNVVKSQLGELHNNAKKDDGSNLEYNLAEKIIMRNRMYDRKFPVETVQLKMHETKNDEELEGAMIHTGAYSDEMARSLHVLAFTIGKDIFFRNGAYKPETEGGRSLLAHELAHVSQYNEHPSEDNRTIEDLEKEAEFEEQKEIFDSDPFMEIEFENKNFKIRQSKYKKLQIEAKRELEKWVEEQEYTMSSEEYLKLLCNYEKFQETE